MNLFATVIRGVRVRIRPKAITDSEGETALLAGEIAAILELYRSGRIRPHVDSTFPFAQAADAHRRIQERKNVGKVVLVP